MNIEDKFVFEQILENCWEAIVYADLQGTVIYTNKAAELLYGYEPGELIGKSVDIFNSHLSHNTDVIIESIKNAGYWKGEIVQRRKDDSPITCLLAVSLLKNVWNEPIGLVSNSKNITEQKLQEEILRKIENNENISFKVIKELQNEQSQMLKQLIFERTKELDISLAGIKKDLSVAKKIQSNILPDKIDSLDRLKFCIRYIPLQEVGGDFYDISKNQEGDVRVLVADATGHGVQGALVTMAIKGEYEILKQQVRNPAELLTILNKRFIEKYNSLNSYFSCCILDFDLRNFKLEVASAGHPSQFLLRDEEVHTITKTGRIIGVVSEVNYKLKQYDIQPGDRLFLFSDGIYEEFNSDESEFGEERLVQIFKEYKNLQLNDSVETILRNLKTFLNGKPIQDDITLIGIDIT